MAYTRTFYYQKNCLISPIVPSMVFGGIFAGLDVVQGYPLRDVLRPRVIGGYIAVVYGYNILQCPMEAIHGRQSLLHNVLSAGTIGFVGVRSGSLGIPFVDPTFVYRYRGLSPAGLAFLVYGAMGGVLAGLGGKPL